MFKNRVYFERRLKQFVSKITVKLTINQKRVSSSTELAEQYVQSRSNMGDFGRVYLPVSIAKDKLQLRNLASIRLWTLLIVCI